MGTSRGERRQRPREPTQLPDGVITERGSHSAAEEEEQEEREVGDKSEERSVQRQAEAHISREKTQTTVRICEIQRRLVRREDRVRTRPTDNCVAAELY